MASSIVRAFAFTLVVACGSESSAPSDPSSAGRGGGAGSGGAGSGGAAGSSATGGASGGKSEAGKGGDGAGGGAGANAGTSGASGGGASGSGTAGTSVSGGSGGAAGNGASGAGATGGTTDPGEAGGGGAAGGGEPTDPAPGEYGEREELLAANSEMAVAELDGKIYVLGGYPASRVIQDAVQIYDIASGAWSLGTPLPEPLHHPVAVGLAGKVYVLGGQLTMGSDADSDRTLEYDPATELWNELAPMPTARGAGAAAVIDDKIYVVGGRPPAGNAFEVYDVSDDAWTELAPLPTAFDQRNHLAATAIGGKVYVAGGRYDGGSFGDPMTDALDVYDPAENSWTAAAPLPRPRGGVNGIAAYGCFYVWGGEGSNIGEPNDVFPDHDVYDPRTDTWTSLAPLPTPIHGVTGAAFAGGLIYMPGGGTQSGGSSGSVLFQVYRPELRCE